RRRHLEQHRLRRPEFHGRIRQHRIVRLDRARGEPASAPGYEAADAAPTTEGLEILTDDEDIREAGRIRATASGFDAGDKGILVVLYNGDGEEPVVIDDSATADDDGV